MESHADVIPTFPEYQKDVTDALDKWLDAVHNSSHTTQRVLKQEAEDRIAAWKASYPRRSATISSYVQNHIAQRFK